MEGLNRIDKSSPGVFFSILMHQNEHIGSLGSFSGLFFILDFYGSNFCLFVCFAIYSPDFICFWVWLALMALSGPLLSLS